MFFPHYNIFLHFSNQTSLFVSLPDWIWNRRGSQFSFVILPFCDSALSWITTRQSRKNWHLAVPVCWVLSIFRHSKEDFVMSCDILTFIFKCPLVLLLAAPGGWGWQQSAKKEETEPGLPAALHYSQDEHTASHLHSWWWEEIQWLLQQTPLWPTTISVLCSSWADGARVSKSPFGYHKFNTSCWIAWVKIK